MSTRRKKISKKAYGGDIKHKKGNKHATEKESVSQNQSKSKDTKRLSQKQLSGRRLWLFRIVSLTVIPFLLILLIEIALRLIGTGFPTATTLKCKINGVDSYCNNHQFAWRFFHPNFARMSNPFVFSVKKSSDTYRIFVLGASAAAGTPDGAFSFGRILQVMLTKRYPNTNFEVINPSMPAINSHVVLEMAKDCARHQPDLFIVYLGNNEVVGPYGAGTVFTPLSSNLSFIRFRLALKATKLGQLIIAFLQSAGLSRDPGTWRGMEMFLEKQVRADDPGLEVVYNHFGKNLQDIYWLAYDNGIKVIACTVPSNLKDSPPFASLHRSNITDAEMEKFEELYQRGIDYEDVKSYPEAIEQYLSAAEIDDSFADLQFRLGRCYWALGQYQESRDRYIRARELDTLRFRANNRINEIIRSIALRNAAEGIYLFDAVDSFEQQSPKGIPGDELFYEHVHMNFSGNYLLAGVICSYVEKLLPNHIKQYGAKDAQYLTDVESAEYLAFTDWEKFRILDKVLEDYIKQPPFTNQLYHLQQVEQMEQQIYAVTQNLPPEALDKIEAQYQWAIQQIPSDWWLYWKYGELLESRGKYDAANRQYRLVLDRIPNHYEAYAKLGFIAGVMKDLDTSIEYNLKALRIYPKFSAAYYNLGFAYHLRKDFDKAVENYSRVIELLPNKPQSYVNLGLVLYLQGKAEQAIEAYRSGLKFIPDNFDLHYNLGLVLKDQGHRDEALQEFREALRIDPNSPKASRALNFTLKESNQEDHE